MFVEKHYVTPMILLKEKTILLYLIIIPVLTSNWFSGELFFANRKRQMGFYTIGLILLLVGIEKEIRIGFSIKIKDAKQIIIEICKEYFAVEFNPGISDTSCAIFYENKEEAYRSKVYTSKFMLQKW